MRCLCMILIAVTLAGCESKSPVAPVLVYAAGEAGSELDSLLAEFTEETNIPVVVSWGDSSSNTDKLLNNVNDRTDVLITSNVADIWRAADEGSLRPIRSAAFDSVPTFLKDSEGSWAAIGMRLHVIAVANADVQPIVEGYDALASAQLRGRLCLSSSSLHVNRSLIAMLINDRGAKKAERLVRSWVQNLAMPPLASQEALLDALREGRCEYGIVAVQAGNNDPVVFKPEPIYLDIDGIGVARHAQQPQAAQQLVDWLLRKTNIQIGSDAETRPVGIAGWLDEDAKLLAERASYR